MVGNIRADEIKKIQAYDEDNGATDGERMVDICMLAKANEGEDGASMASTSNRNQALHRARPAVEMMALIPSITYS